MKVGKIDQSQLKFGKTDKINFTIWQNQSKWTLKFGEINQNRFWKLKKLLKFEFETWKNWSEDILEKFMKIDFETWKN